MHLGLGNFFRAHQAWYTDRSPDAAAWGIAAFTGRHRGLTDALRAQNGRYTLVTRAAGRDGFELVGSLSAVHAAEDHDAWLRHLSSPEVAAVTITITEAGYRGGPALGRLLAGLSARRDADAGPIALVPCDNLPGNGAVVSRLLAEAAELADPGLALWLAESVSTVTTVVDRITPRTEPADLLLVARETGFADRAPVVAEPFAEWVLSGSFPGGRPRWEDAGAIVTDDVAPFEERKLWLLNGGHSLLAYAGSALGHTTVAEAVADDACRSWLEQWWEEASRHLRLPAAGYREALVDRFENPRIRHRLGQIAADGSQKLPVRILPVLGRERAAGRVPGGAACVLAAWVCHVRRLGPALEDARAAELVPLATGPLPAAVRRLLEALDPAVGGDDAVVAAVLARAERLATAPGRTAGEPWS